MTDKRVIQASGLSESKFMTTRSSSDYAPPAQKNVGVIVAQKDAQQPEFVVVRELNS